ncbi:hypothetical protein KAR91_08580 [Candidatus Pacearchaeota archaeon]|nr:hypothetical protein [Candidatus Pacearchaeota archaeon]
MRESDKLQSWFNLSYASFLTLPRVLMEDMPSEWQDKMADLLNEYDEAYPNLPEIGTRVQATKRGKLVRFPAWLLNYRRPSDEDIKAVRA